MTREITMLEPDSDGLIDGMTRSEYGQVDELIRQLDHADWIYDLDHKVDAHRQAALAQLDEVARVFKGFNDAQRRHFRRTYTPRTMSLNALLPLMEKLGLATPTP